jgi:hypothetical protein
MRMRADHLYVIAFCLDLLKDAYDIYSRYIHSRHAKFKQFAYPNFEFPPTFQGFLKMNLLDASFVLE